ncbi:MAG: DegT/DnrJ/EryC1/StrS family aminotransferase [Anaerolineales bacterium]|nr:DegT/DnrJ/EryC1/StrS family aminotransferase [Anaerolineales bacterium]
MSIPLVDLKAQYQTIRPEIEAAIQRVLENTNFIMGGEVTQFEQAFAHYVGVKEVVGVASGTAALQLALAACQVKPGDEVITTAHTFIATAEPISYLGAKPVFVDIDPRTYNLDANHVEAAITPQTRAIIAVHLYGQPADMEPLLDIAKRHQLYMIEDAAQAHGARYHGQTCGSMGHLACFSFFPGKNLGAYGDAGAVSGNDPELMSRVRRLRNHGRISKYEHEEVGYGERLDTLQAAVLNVKLKCLEAWTEARRSRARLYNELLAGLDLVTPWEAPDVRHVYHLYVLRSSQRDALLTHLKAKGVEAGIHYPVPLHRQPAYLKLGYSDITLPKTEQAAREVLSLPMYPELTAEQINYIVEQIKEFDHGR